MTRVILPSRAALADFDRIYDFIAPHNSRTAAEVLRSLDKAIQLLSLQPQLGRPYQQGAHRLRLLVHGDYAVFYSERPGIIELIRVLHDKRDVPDVLDG